VHARDKLQLELAPELVSATNSVHGATYVAADMFHASGPSVARAALNEIVRRSSEGRVALLIDGLEKLPQGPTAQEIFEALSRMPDKIDLIVVVPWHSVFGGGTESILRAGERLHRRTADIAPRRSRAASHRATAGSSLSYVSTRTVIANHCGRYRTSRTRT
jgi:hypothetical protein